MKKYIVSDRMIKLCKDIAEALLLSKEIVVDKGRGRPLKLEIDLITDRIELSYSEK